uniref:(northern house mosquito) hypothetical protein n=1 Tax=Culex pipiens TaxID=7175 RepID=A0A8D8KQC7_CULPI
MNCSRSGCTCMSSLLFKPTGSTSNSNCFRSCSTMSRSAGMSRFFFNALTFCRTSVMYLDKAAKFRDSTNPHSRRIVVRFSSVIRWTMSRFGCCRISSLLARR